MGELVSVIIPIYNAEKYIKDCLYCVLNQTYKDLEIVLVNDGSTDNCKMICDNVAKRDSRVKVVHQTNKGLPAARNSGLKVATGKWIFFLDSDDWIHFNTIEILSEIAEDYKEVDLILFDVIRTTDFNPGLIDVRDSIKKTRLLTNIEVKNIRDDCLSPMNEQFDEMSTAKVVACSKLYRRDFLKDNDVETGISYIPLQVKMK